MNSILSIITEIIIGLLGVVTGIVTAVVSVHLQNKSKCRFDHHLKHKENFEVLKGDIEKVCLDVYPYKDNKESLFICGDYNINDKFWENYSIFNYSDIIKKEEKTYEIRKIDKLLYNDIKNHWPEFYEELNNWSEKIKTIGKKSCEIRIAIFETICKLLEDPNVTPHINYISKNQILLQNYALAVYNFVMDTNPDEWPNLYSKIDSSKINQLKKLAEDVKHEKNKELKDFYSNVKPFLDIAKDLINNLDKLIHNEKIKHNCEYIK